MLRKSSGGKYEECSFAELVDGMGRGKSIQNNRCGERSAGREAGRDK